MSLENRSNSALFKRAEQLKRWEESETNRESTQPKRDRRKVKFSAGCVFLAACAAGDRDEVQRLIQNGADIDTANVDGLTALHQACIDDNLDMVEFLVSRGADVNRGDNEGWTPLHATASCGFLSIARHLMERGADVAAVNNDGELPLDIAESDDMELLLFSNVTAKGIDCDTARNKEERLMLADAKEWLNSGQICDKPHPKTGATALHVAAAKGYYRVMEVLLQAGADVNARDVDGWTALHAASHWAQREACDLLVEALCDMDAKNYVGQTSEDVADAELLPHLEELRKKQAVLLKGRPPAAILPPKRSSVQAPNSKRRSLDNSADNLNIDASATVQGNNNNLPTTNNQQIISSVTRMSAGDKSSLVSKDVSAERQTLSSQTGEDTPTESEDTHTTTSEESEIEKRNRANKSDNKSTSFSAPNSPPKAPLETDESGVPSWRRPGSLRGRTNGREDTSRISNRSSDRNSSESNPDVVLRRTQSFEPDDSEKRQSANSAPVSPAKTPGSLNLPTQGMRSQSVSVTAPASPSTPTSGSKLSPGNIFKNFFKSFVPPVRDEESETQRKAHAKRVRETRRSTQGVTLEEIKSAEQLVKKKQQQTEPQEEEVVAKSTQVTVVQKVDATDTGTEADSKAERRPSWRLKFLLEDARGAASERGGGDTRTSNVTSDTSSYLRRGSATSKASTTSDNNPSTENSVTVALRRPAAKTIPSPIEDKDQDKENDSRSAQATQAVIQRRRRPKRRSTGVVHVDMDEIDPDRQEGGTTEGDETTKSEESDRSGRSSRLSSVSSAQDASEETAEVAENGQLDYKKLYEESRTENERLRLRLRRIEDELKDSKNEKSGAKSAMSELEKRERRAMERKLSEMEEELKQFQKLKAENEKLKAENRALTRVVSKLSSHSGVTTK